MDRQEMESRIARYKTVLEKTTDDRERLVIEGVIKKLEDQLESAKAEPEKPKAEEKVEEKTEKPEGKKRGRPKKEPAEAEEKKPTKEKPKREKPAKKERPPKAAKEPKKAEKTVKISKVVPEDEKKNVKDILENEHYKVIIKEKDGKKIKITIKNSDRVVAKNKVESAFVTISKKVTDSEDERKKYADDIKALEAMRAKITELIENIYKAFNSHKTEELKSILKKLKTI